MLNDWINSIKISEMAKGAGEFIADQMNQIKTQGIFGWIKNKLSEIGTWLAEVIGGAIKLGVENSKDLIKDLMPSLNPFKGLKWPGFKPDTAGADNSKGIERNTGETNNILRRIAEGSSIATYA